MGKEGNSLHTLAGNDQQKPPRNCPHAQTESGNNCSPRIIRHIIPITCLVYNVYLNTPLPIYSCRQ